MQRFDPPHLPTLEQAPSWLNARGHIDRSACLEVTLREIRRLAQCVVIDPYDRDARYRPRRYTHPLPNERPAPNCWGRVAAGCYVISANDLRALHAMRMPRRLAGDFRTARANATRPKSWKPGRTKQYKFRHRVDRQHPIAWPADENIDRNPNKGASIEKVLGLWPHWSQPIAIEKWIFPKRIQPAYYLICPGHSQGIYHGGHGEHGEGRKGKRRQIESSGGGTSASCLEPNHSSVISVSSVVNAQLSTCKPGRKDPATKKCPQRCLKLLLPLCTPDEWRDAKLAQVWITSLPPQMLRPRFAIINELHKRYGLLFEPRLLLCPRCCGGGVKYGNNPETVRQGWRRRNNKPDTTIVNNIGGLPVKLNHWSRSKYEMSMLRIYGQPQRPESIEAYEAEQEAQRARKKARQRERKKQYLRARYRRNMDRYGQQTPPRAWTADDLPLHAAAEAGGAGEGKGAPEHIAPEKHAEVAEALNWLEQTAAHIRGVNARIARAKRLEKRWEKAARQVTNPPRRRRR